MPDSCWCLFRHAVYAYCPCVRGTEGFGRLNNVVQTSTTRMHHGRNSTQPIGGHHIRCCGVVVVALLLANSPPDGIRFLPQEEDTIAEIHAEIKGPGEYLVASPVTMHMKNIVHHPYNPFSAAQFSSKRFGPGPGIFWSAFTTRLSSRVPHHHPAWSTAGYCWLHVVV